MVLPWAIITPADQRVPRFQLSQVGCQIGPDQLPQVDCQIAGRMDGRTGWFSINFQGSDIYIEGLPSRI